MSEDEGKVRKLRSVRRSLRSVDLPAAYPDEVVRETASSVLPGLPRVGALDALLREVDGLRLSLETDLSLAASAVELGTTTSLGVARDIIDSDLAGLHGFETRALEHLAGLSHTDTADDDAVHRAWWRRVPATPFVAAASVVAFVLLAVPHTGHKAIDVDATNVSAQQRLEQISQLARDGQTSEIRDAAVSLHGQLLSLVLQAKTDPLAAQQGLQLLSDERSIIALSGDSAALTDVLADSANLSNLIISRLPAAIRPTVKTVQPVAVLAPTAQPSQRSSARPTHRPTSAPSSKPSSKPTTRSSSAPSSKPSSSSSPSPTPSNGSGPVLPTGPGVQ